MTGVYFILECGGEDIDIPAAFTLKDSTPSAGIEELLDFIKNKGIIYDWEKVAIPAV